jgi:hypothetical protein
MDAPAVSLSQAAALAEVPTGTVASWRSHGVCPQKDYDDDDLLSLALLGDLVRMGLQLRPAACIARACKERWRSVVAASPRRTMLLARSNGPDGKWVLAFCSPAEVPAFPVGETLVVDLHGVVQRVRGKLGTGK